MLVGGLVQYGKTIAGVMTRGGTKKRKYVDIAGTGSLGSRSVLCWTDAELPSARSVLLPDAGLHYHGGASPGDLHGRSLGRRREPRKECVRRSVGHLLLSLHEVPDDTSLFLFAVTIEAFNANKTHLYHAHLLQVCQWKPLLSPQIDAWWPVLCSWCSLRAWLSRRAWPSTRRSSLCSPRRTSRTRCV